MAITTQDVQSAYDAYNKAYNDTLVKFDEALHLAEAVQANPKSPDAQAQLDKANALVQEAKSIYNSTAKPLGQQFIDLRKNADPSVQSETQDLEEFRSKKFTGLLAKRDITTLDIKSAQEKVTANKQDPKSPEPPPTPAPTAVAAPDPNKPKNPLTGSADGDKNPTEGKTQSVSQAGGKSTNDSNSNKELPGKRTYNPLGDYPSTTYSISLYMISPESYDEFVSSGRKTINTAPGSGTYLIVQSGGVNNTTTQRAAGFTLDYYIDNLNITTYTSAKETETATNTSEIKFQIIEPYGFSFISSLSRASDALKQKSQAAQAINNASRQFFILAIRFLGWDKDGKPISAKDNTTGATKQYIDEKFYDIAITSVKFSLNSKQTIYDIVATSLSPATAFGMKRGIWKNGGEIDATTVGEALQKMMAQMNDQEKELVKDKPQAKFSTFDFAYIGDGAEEGENNKKSGPIFTASMRSTSQLNKSRLPTSDAKNTSEAAKPSDAKPEDLSTRIAIAPGTPVLQAFETIISRSSYIEDAFKVLKTSADEKNAENKANDQSKVQESKAKIKWYNVSAECSKGFYDESTQDWVWNIKYVFRVYETPMVDNAYSNLGIGYYGPHKRYSFLFGGKNTEILSYTQQLNNAYYNVHVGATTKDNPGSSGTPGTATNQGTPSDAARTGLNNQEKQETLAFMNSLFDPGSVAVSQLNIIGDPDYLMPDTSSSIAKVYNTFYDINGYTINPNGGQVFIEIDFKEAQDYGYKTSDGITYSPTNDGLLSLNDRIEFWRYQKDIADKIKGVSYMVTKVNSTFRDGNFQQNLTLVINTFPGYKKQDERSDTPSTPSQTQTDSNTDQGTKPTTNPDAVTGDKTVDNLINLASGDGGQAGTKPTTNGPVADDDSKPPTVPSNPAINQDGRPQVPIPIRV